MHRSAWKAGWELTNHSPKRGGGGQSLWQCCATCCCPSKGAGQQFLASQSFKLWKLISLWSERKEQRSHTEEELTLAGRNEKFVGAHLHAVGCRNVCVCVCVWGSWQQRRRSWGSYLYDRLLNANFFPRLSVFLLVAFFLWLLFISLRRCAFPSSHSCLSVHPSWFACLQLPVSKIYSGIFFFLSNKLPSQGAGCNCGCWDWWC